MRILITGVTGFVGGHLVEALERDSTHELLGLSRRAQWPAEWSHLTGKVLVRPVDLLDVEATEKLLGDFRPEWIFHLAGFANPGKSFQQADAAWEGNLLATRRLYQAVTQRVPRARILFISTGLVYGEASGGLQLCREDQPLHPSSPYAASKAAAELLSYQVTRHPGLDVVRVRAFTQIGPRQSADYAVSNFARQIAAIEEGRQAPVLETGDLSGQRDLTDVRDMVQAFRLLMQSGQSGEVYNAGSGAIYSIQSILDQLLNLARVAVEVRQKIDPNRKADAFVSRADVSKLERATGWGRTHPLDQTLADILDYWRGVGGGEG